VLGHGGPRRSPETPSIGLKLTRIIKSTESPSLKDVVEVVLTNTGQTPISIPIGTDTVPLLAPTETERRYLSFAVRAGPGIADTVATAMSAANSGHPESRAVLKPGDTAVFKLPISGYYMVGSKTAAADKLTIGVSVTLNRKMIDGGIDYNEQIGDSINSDNVLPRP
jgi:hypothetical protein